MSVDPLDRLRREALAERPEFSEELHGRMREAVFAQPAHDAVVARPAARRRRFSLLPAAVAAAAVLVGAILAWQALFVGRGTQPVVEVPAPAPAPNERPAPRAPRSVPPDDRDLAAIGELAGEANEQIAGLMERTAHWQQLARVDYGAALALRALSDRVPLDAVAALALADASPANGGKDDPK